MTLWSDAFVEAAADEHFYQVDFHQYSAGPCSLIYICIIMYFIEFYILYIDIFPVIDSLHFNKFSNSVKSNWNECDTIPHFISILSRLFVISSLYVVLISLYFTLFFYLLFSSINTQYNILIHHSIFEDFTVSIASAFSPQHLMNDFVVFVVVDDDENDDDDGSTSENERNKPIECVLF